MKALLKALDLDAIIGLDFETFYSKEYTLSRMSTTDYITDPRFKVQMCSTQFHNEKRAKVLDPAGLQKFSKTIDWSRTGLLAHHAHFDGLIASRYYGINPKMYFDTLSMAKPIMPVEVGGSLNKLCRSFGLKGKEGSEHLENVMGIRDLTEEQYTKLAGYAGNDIEQTWLLFKKLLPYTSLEELKVIDLTVRMYAQPIVLIEESAMRRINKNQRTQKSRKVNALGVSREDLASNNRFADLLRNAGVEPPVKISKRTGKETYAFSKGDLAFKALLAHPKKAVQELMQARLAVKTSIVETRTLKFADRAKLGAQPVYLKYCGAHTHRWSGSDKANWQNLDKKSGMRRAIKAPPKHLFIIADQSQVEARLTAWRAGQEDIVDAFRTGQDVYKVAAAQTYRKPIEKVTDKERFVGKTQVLGLGFGAGPPRFADMLRVGQFGPPVPISDEDAGTAVRAWRGSNHRIVQYWKNTENNARSAFFGRQKISDNLLTYEGVGQHGFVHLPNGMSLRYDNINNDEQGGFYYVGRNGKHIRLWGGTLVENEIQALARCIFAHQMVCIAEALPTIRVANCTHDEMLLVVPEKKADMALSLVKEIMSTSPSWGPDLPLGVKANVSEIYDKV
jgi:hypothetical protein